MDFLNFEQLSPILADSMNNMEFIVEENIEMELFSTEEPCEMIQSQEEAAARLQWGHLEHPLVQCFEEELRETRGRRLNRRPENLQPPAAVDDVLIEMEVLQPLKIRNNKAGCDHKASGLKWKKLLPQKSRFVVKDVLFLPRDQYLAQIESLVFARRREVSMVSARITVDHSWSAAQMDARLRLVLRREFGKAVARKTQFTYLQSVQSSRSLFAPLVPVDGWSGANVLRISALGPLYVLIQQDTSTQVKHEQPSSHSVNNRKNGCPSIKEKKEACHISNKRSEELRKELQSALSLFTRESPGVELLLQVRRGAVLPSALKAVRRSGFCFRATPIITFCGEETEDHQGPVREFFRLMLQELQKTSLFEGQPGRLLLTADLSSLEDWRYYEAGLLIGWSLAHGGPGPRCLHPALYQFMCGHSAPLHDFSWRDIVDIEIQSHLQQLQACSDVRLLSPSLGEWVLSCGVPDISPTSAEEMPNIYRRVVKHYIHNRVSRMILQLTEGLNSCDGLWDVMRTHWEAFAPVMTSAHAKPLALADFTELLTVSFSSDCVEEEQERETVAHWEIVLGHISDGEASFSFEDLLMFITGVDHHPPLGFSSLITLCFYSQDAVLSSVRLPFASTCTLELFLPRRVGDAAELMMLLTRAVKESQGFTRLNKEEKEHSIETVGSTRMTSQSLF